MFSFTLFAANPTPCDLVDHLDATDASVVHSTRELSEKLEDFEARCEIGALPMDGTFSVYHRLQEHLQAPGTDEEVVERSLLVARVVQQLRDTSLVGTMVGLSLELEAQRRIDDVGTELLAEHGDVLWDLADSPPLDLAFERKALEDLGAVELTWSEALFFSLAVNVHALATYELQELIDRPDAIGALDTWEASHPVGQAWTPWGRMGESYRSALPTILRHWVEDRREADRGWRRLAGLGERAR